MLPGIGTGPAGCQRPVRVRADSRNVAVDRPENAPRYDVFSHNRNRSSGREHTRRHFDLALLTITGAAYSDQLLTSDQETAQRAN